MKKTGVFLIAAFILSTTVYSQNDWRTYGNDAGHARFSTLKQITPQNVSMLRPAWTFDLKTMGRKWENTPVVIDNTMYITLPNGGVVALEPENGEEIWRFETSVRGRPVRAVAYWPGDSDTSPRLLYGAGDTLVALDPKTGKPIEIFGNAILGASEGDGAVIGPAGDPQAFDIKTGKLVWRFHTVPQLGEPNNETWGPGWRDRGGPSLWGLITVDTERGLVFFPVGNPGGSFYGADRPGSNLFSVSVLALDAATGKYKWHFQTTHHDLMDSDLAAAPALIDVVQNGRRMPAVAQVTKMGGMLFILDRLTGKPIYGVEERPVPASDVPGEESAHTQELVAINANTGDIAWKIPLGIYEDLIAKGIPPTGTPNLGPSQRLVASFSLEQRRTAGSARSMRRRERNYGLRRSRRPPSRHQ